MSNITQIILWFLVLLIIGIMMNDKLECDKQDGVLVRGIYWFECIK